MKNSLHILSSIAVISLLTSCATTNNTAVAQSSGVNADYDGNGIISETEYQKYKQINGMQGSNQNKTLPNISTTSRTVRDTLWSVQTLKNFF